MTLVEVLIVVALLAGVMLMMNEGIDAGMKVNRQMERTNQLDLLGHDILRQIERDASRSHRIFTESTAARDLLARFEGSLSVLLKESFLPVGDSSGILCRDERDERRTGDMLMFAASIPPIAIDVAGAFMPPHVVRIDRYRFVVYHLSTHAQATGEAPQRELVRWTSRPIASYTQATKVASDEDRLRLLRALADAGVVTLWDSTTDDMAAAFHPIVDAEEDDFVLAADAGFVVPRDPISSCEGFLTHRRAGIAADATKAPGSRVFAPVGVVSPPGFEVKMVGPASARQVLVNLTMVAYDPNMPAIMLRKMLVVSARDL